ncbi:MAG TPA: hypothetical protein VFN77_00740, partial [Acetobacteraceae bacterium]|nr:hypothetical protein [Acetobacteraceae bacterium]
YGLDLDALDHLPQALRALPLQRLRAAMPFNLATILFAEGMRRLGLGARRADIRRELILAAEAADVLIRMLGALFLNDGMTEAVAWAARAELAIEAAERGDAAALQAVASLPGDGDLAPRHREIAWRALIELVNAGAVEAARSLAAQEGLNGADGALPRPLRRNGLIVLGQMALAEGGDPMQAAGIARQIGSGDPVAEGLLLGAFTRLVNAGRYDEAAALSGEVERSARGDETGRDARLALAVLDLASGDPARVPARIEGLDIEPARRRALLLAAFTRLVNAGRYSEALSLREAFPIREWAADTSDPDGADAGFAMVMLELAEGDPARIPALLAALPDLLPETREALLLQAFLRLVNAGRLDEARDFAAREDIEAAALRAEPPLRADATAALITVDLAPGGEPERIAPRLDALEQTDPARVKSLAIHAFVTLVNQGGFAAAQALRPRIEPAFASFAKAATPEARDAGFALGVLNLQEPPQPYRAEAAFAAVRRGFADDLREGDAAPSLFWEALRGELVALHQTNRGAEAQALARAMLARYQGAPEDMRRDFGPGGARGAA